MTSHSLGLGTTDDGWDYSTCECGWISPPCPGVEEACGFWADHMLPIQTALIDGPVEGKSNIGESAP